MVIVILSPITNVLVSGNVTRIPVDVKVLLGGSDINASTVNSAPSPTVLFI